MRENSEIIKTQKLINFDGTDGPTTGRDKDADEARTLGIDVVLDVGVKNRSNGIRRKSDLKTATNKKINANLFTILGDQGVWEDGSFAEGFMDSPTEPRAARTCGKGGCGKGRAGR